LPIKPASSTKILADLYPPACLDGLQTKTHEAIRCGCKLDRTGAFSDLKRRLARGLLIALPPREQCIEALANALKRENRRAWIDAERFGPALRNDQENC